jgi:lipopolysaccharide/colanic/teichoic acid biosynthesis glycosyltransferase
MRSWLLRRAVLIAWDSLGWVLALFLAATLRQDLSLGRVDAAMLLKIVVVALATEFVIYGMLQTWHGRHPIGSIEDAVNVSTAAAVVGAIVFSTDFLGRAPTPRSVPLLATLVVVLFAVGSRLAYRLARERRYRADYSTARRVIIYGAGLEGQQLLRQMRADPTGSYLPVALLDDNPAFRRRRIFGVAVQGTRADVAAAAERSGADLLVVANPTMPLDVMREIADAADDAALEVAMVPSLGELLKPLAGAPQLPTPRFSADGLPVERNGHRRPAAAPIASPRALSCGKRVFDIVVCLVAAVVVVPFLLVLGLILKVNNSQVIYRAPRIGLDGRQFMMLKLATMIPGDKGPRVTLAGDPRITPIGRWLRATKLNELPQIFNIIKGDMSLVGPRAEDPRYAVRYSERQRRVLTVRPGLTSRAFLFFGDEQAFIERARPSDVESYYLHEVLPRKLDIELDYVENWSMREDLRILAGTLKFLLY